MPITVNCMHCNTRLRVADNLTGKQIRCPKYRSIFRLEAEQPDEADSMAMDDPANEPPGSPSAMPEVLPADDQERPRPKRRRFKRTQKTTNVEQTIKTVGGVLAALLGGGAGIFLLFVFLGFAGTPAIALGDLADIMEKAATALENAREPGKRASAAQELERQADRLNTWVTKYANKEVEEVVLKAAARRYGPRIEQGIKRQEAALAALNQDRAAFEDQRL
ncbi:MAG: hypothetical protein NZM31_10560, partial [Gemmatales bacterium]|nr:hypothetical protein [Gemmatales bacterium]MDW8387437.1 hypothetical protein [Gemmatales bacterium]